MPRATAGGERSKGDGRHPRNTLNDLTNREWLIATKSVWYSRPGSRDPLKIQHPATFPEKDVAALIRFFTRRGERVLDPFVGTGSTLLACHETGRRGVGIELSPRWAAVTRERLSREGVPIEAGRIEVLEGDVRSVLPTLPAAGFDFTVTSPPYWQILGKKPDHKVRTERLRLGLSTRYSEEGSDLGNLGSYEAFRAEMRGIWQGCLKVLRPGRYLAVVVSDFRDGGRLVPYHAHTADDAGSAGFTLQGIGILVQDNKRLYPYGMPNTFVPNIHHQYILVLRRPAHPPRRPRTRRAAP